MFSPNRAGGSLLGNEVLPGTRDHGGSGRGDGEVTGEKRGKGGSDIQSMAIGTKMMV